MSFINHFFNNSDIQAHSQKGRAGSNDLSDNIQPDIFEELEKLELKKVAVTDRTVRRLGIVLARLSRDKTAVQLFKTAP